MQLQSISRNIQNVIKNSNHFLNAHLCSPHKNLQSYHTKKIEKYHTVTEKFAPRPSKNSTKLQQFFDSHFWYTQSPYSTQKPPNPSHKETFKFPQNPAQFTPETLFIHLRNQNLSNVPHFFQYKPLIHAMSTPYGAKQLLLRHSRKALSRDSGKSAGVPGVASTGPGLYSVGRHLGPYSHWPKVEY